MITLPKPSERNEPVLDPQDVLVGKCASCSSEVTTTRTETKMGIGPWASSMMPAAGCPSCGAVVYVFPEKKPTAALLDEALAENAKLRVVLLNAKDAVRKLTALLHQRDAELFDLRRKPEPVEVLADASTFGKMLAALKAEADVADWTEADEAWLRAKEKDKLPPLPEGFDFEEDGE